MEEPARHHIDTPPELDGLMRALERNLQLCVVRPAFPTPCEESGHRGRITLHLALGPVGDASHRRARTA